MLSCFNKFYDIIVKKEKGINLFSQKKKKGFIFL